MSELPVNDLLSVDEAVDILDAIPLAPRVLTLPIAQVRGYVLADDLRADRDYPPFDKSMMDGYAVCTDDVRRGPATLACLGEIAAGQAPDVTISPGRAVAIMTGAPLPAGADGVVPVELTDRAGDQVRVRQAMDARRYVARQASDMPAGSVVLGRGVRLEAAQLAVAATVGAANVPVYDRPRVAVLATGDELVAVDQTPGAASIRNSNNIMLTALLGRMGCAATDLGTVPDRPELIRQAIERGLGFDALFITGGMSMGQYDYVPRLLIEAGVELKITKLRIKPGKPFVFGVREGSGQVAGSGFGGQGSGADQSKPVLVFGLPGNPVSAFVCTVRLASRALRRMMGEAPDGLMGHGALSESLPGNGPREFYQPAVFDGRRVRPLHWKGSADVFTLAQANALLRRKADDPVVEAGTMVQVMML